MTAEKIIVGMVIATVLAVSASVLMNKVLKRGPKKPKLEAYALSWVLANFDKLVDDSRESEELITEKSLRSAFWARPYYGAQLNHAIRNIAYIGHQITEDTAAKAVACVMAGDAAAMGTAVIAASPVAYGISRNDLQRAINEAVYDIR
jgi:hypothetical protein